MLNSELFECPKVDFERGMIYGWLQYPTLFPEAVLARRKPDKTTPDTNSTAKQMLLDLEVKRNNSRREIAHLLTFW